MRLDIEELSHPSDRVKRYRRGEVPVTRSGLYTKCPSFEPTGYKMKGTEKKESTLPRHDGHQITEFLSTK